MAVNECNDVRKSDDAFVNLFSLYACNTYFLIAVLYASRYLKLKTKKNEKEPRKRGRCIRLRFYDPDFTILWHESGDEESTRVTYVRILETSYFLNFSNSFI